MDDDVVALLRELVAIPSMNPYLTGRLGDGYGEAQVAERVAAFLRHAGPDVELCEVMPGRPSVVARLDGPDGGDPLVFVAHLDTVPADGMTVPPFEGRIEGERLYGRGACDNKAALAAMLCALRRVAAARANRAPILFAGTIDEESTYAGTRALLADGLAARGAIVGEPTGLDVVIAHKGALRIAITATGRSAHSSTPELGENAIYRMARLVADLEALAGELPKRDPHPLVGPPTLSVGTIHGGLTINTVPDRCAIEVDRRLMPGEPVAPAQAEIRAIAEKHGADFELVFATEGFEIAEDHELVAMALDAIVATRGEADIIGVPYGTEASAFSAAGIPTLVLGPGDAAQAHAADEWVALPQVAAAARIYERIMAAA